MSNDTYTLIELGRERRDLSPDVFRETVLMPALRRGRHVTVDLRGPMVIPSGWMRGLFAHPEVWIYRDRLSIVSDDVSMLTEVRSYLLAGPGPTFMMLDATVRTPVRIAYPHPGWVLLIVAVSCLAFVAMLWAAGR